MPALAAADEIVLVSNANGAPLIRPAIGAAERHDWKAAAALEAQPVWFPWDRFRNVEALVHFARPEVEWARGYVGKW